ncbi:MAG TPA: bacterioferritin [Planctomycetaceae bacterium]|nr:bacterioferritin [Planctomycetaceae bacterium]
MPATNEKEARRVKVIEVLNTARSMELHAIHQYMNQHYNLDNMDYGQLAAGVKKAAIDEMRHAEMFAERIADLNGQPTTEIAGKVMRGQTVDEVFPFDANQEDDTMDAYNRFMIICRENLDGVSATLFETIINEEMEHFNYFDDIGRHIKELGQSFLAKVAGTPAE